MRVKPQNIAADGDVTSERIREAEDGLAIDGNIAFASQAVPVASTIIAAPGAPLRLQEGGETSHHFTISVPIR